MAKPTSGNFSMLIQKQSPGFHVSPSSSMSETKRVLPESILMSFNKKRKRQNESSEKETAVTTTTKRSKKEVNEEKVLPPLYPKNTEAHDVVVLCDRTETCKTIDVLDENDVFIGTDKHEKKVLCKENRKESKELQTEFTLIIETGYQDIYYEIPQSVYCIPTKKIKTHKKFLTECAEEGVPVDDEDWNDFYNDYVAGHKIDTHVLFMNPFDSIKEIYIIDYI